MKLVQLNIWGGRVMPNILTLAEAEQPDIMCLQEVISFDGDINSLFGTIEELQSKLSKPYKDLFYSPGIRFNFMHKNAEWGNAVLSRFKIMEKESRFTNLAFIDNFNFEDYDYNARNFQHCVVEAAGGQKLNILNHHGHHIPGHKNGDNETLRQMKQLADYIDALAGPVILAGDFNLAPHSESLEQINQRLINLSVTHKLQTTRTQLTHKKEVCDYIFVNEQVKVKNFEASDELVSDHKALILEFDI